MKYLPSLLLLLGFFLIVLGGCILFFATVKLGSSGVSNLEVIVQGLVGLCLLIGGKALFFYVSQRL